ncbi:MULTISPECIES: sodium:proton antiporter NhaD [Spirosoma]|uniref:Sodium:proton antiporter NhaD n=1 Tax=Spirosoma liriopis TaxID=2937440 RepID=A0ABT0HTL3_9BACT|nr:MULTISPECIES: sodium:proton antiporter NhaD [Spirosoma]MCK8495477.1 sodium:proton antiporter NhaD [Spirosoma liriopis]UHG94364.1 sodium:proton antiporter NhaD [Spirosoma oryzicola]
MLTTLVILFLLGYALITVEHSIRINKTATALITGVLCWTVYSLTLSDPEPALEALGHHLAEIAQILFFLLGAMTIVELIDIHGGFTIITDRVATRNPRVLLWLIGGLTFILSALLDNLASALVMVSVTRNLVRQAEQRKLIAGMIIIAANAGGAWSPIGDVTTTMLWIGGQVTTVNIMSQLFLPSLVCLLVPLLYLSFTLKSESPDRESKGHKYTSRPYIDPTARRDRRVMFAAGLSAIVMVPIFKSITHLPPYMAMLLALGFVWVVSELIHADKDEQERQRFSVAHALSKIDVPSILFFLGILLAVGSLESVGILEQVATSLNESVGNLDVIVGIIGVASAIVDNVPIVAAAMGMYDLGAYPADHKLWEFLAYCAGTGGSLLVIGSAAGVAVMGMERLEFGWYLRRISGPALLGYLGGALTYLAVYAVSH